MNENEPFIQRGLIYLIHLSVIVLFGQFLDFISI